MSQQPCNVDMISTVINKKKKDMYKLKFINYWLECTKYKAVQSLLKYLHFPFKMIQ